jgi:hypothetical protein
MGVGLVGSILGEWISSKFMNSIVCVGSYSIPCGCYGALRLLRGLLQAWIDAPRLGSAMVVKMIYVELVCSVTLSNSLSPPYILSLYAFSISQ